ncbi:DUF4834 family protein [Hymenobacter tibetensis]|uniref:DUF4834 family protein n=1 Tax=Hymenobacter tibetensis TaxID=497967 RepID=A0ABY4CZ34_9BACT|nr:DUF4834 family protein [Hymenobacter tibetensis]UOG75418.1 DUF4834 family protein [Hymenobacter tibetensis]
MVKFLLIFFLVSLVLRFVLPVLMRWLVVRFVKKQTQRYSQQFGANPFEAPRPEPRNTAAANGQVHVDYVPPKPQAKPAKHFEGGEYVDFEEVK